MTSPTKKGLTRAGIVGTALELLDEVGIDAVTVRALAGRLGVRASALYWHVRDKQELLDEMGTEIQRRVQAAYGTWLADRTDDDHAAELRGYAHVLRAEYLAHRDGARTFAGTRLTDIEVLRAQEPLLARWTAAGRPLAEAVAAAELVTSFVVGFVVEEQERAQSAAVRYDLRARDTALGDDVPLVREAGRVLAGDREVRFDRHLDVLLAGLAAG